MLERGALPTFDVKVERMKYLQEKLEKVEKERDEAQNKWKLLVKGATPVLSEEQLELWVKRGAKPNYKHNTEWGGESIANGITIKNKLRDEEKYNWFISQGYPWPSIWTIQRFNRHMRDIDDEAEEKQPYHQPDDIFHE
jgi:hypothetical protein